MCMNSLPFLSVKGSRFLRFPAYFIYQFGLKRLMKIADAVFTVNLEMQKQLQRGNKNKPFGAAELSGKNVWDYECNIPGSLEQALPDEF